MKSCIQDYVPTDVYYCGDALYIPESCWLSRTEYQTKIQQNPHFDFCGYSHTGDDSVEIVCSRFAISICRVEAGLDKPKYRCGECPPLLEENKDRILETNQEKSIWVESNKFLSCLKEDPVRDYCSYSPPTGSNKNKFCFLTATVTNREQVGSDVAKYRCKHCKEKRGAEGELLAVLAQVDKVSRKQRAFSVNDIGRNQLVRIRNISS